MFACTPRINDLGCPGQCLLLRRSPLRSLTACGSDRNVPGVTRTVTAPASSGSNAAGSGAPVSSTAPTSTSATKTKPAKPTGTAVEVVSAVIGDGSQVGVGLPIMLLLNHTIKDARAFAKATKVTVNGKAVQGGWFVERKYQDPGHPVEADYRTQTTGRVTPRST